MGKNFPQIKTLKENPSRAAETLMLIENSFKYKTPYTFKSDFAPLMDESNHHNCFILVDESDKVLAHIGVKDRIINLNNNSFTISMLGGIAVDENFRGQGHFQLLFQDVMAEKRSDTTFFLLWSDQQELYKKYGFYVCGSQFEIEKSEKKHAFKKVSYQQLSIAHRKQLQKLYETSFKSQYLSAERNEHDWGLIGNILNTELFIKESNDVITDYIFLGKGMDLTGIAHEYGSSDNIYELIKEASALGKVWTASTADVEEAAFYQFQLAPADVKLFTAFISEYTNGQIKIRDINVMKQEVYFDFNQETLALETEEFLKGIFGPGTFEELGELKPLFFSGLDSI